MVTRTALTTFLLVACVSACDDDDFVDDRAALRVVHAAPGAPALDIDLVPGGEPIITGLSYGQASPHIDVEPDRYTVVVRVSGSDTVLDESEIVIDDNDDVVTAIATGYVDSPDPGNAFRLLPIREDFESVAETETALRIVNASPDAPTLDIDIVDTTPVGAATLPRFGETGADELIVPANEMFQVDLAADGVPLTAFTTPSLPARGRLFVIAIGNVADLPRVATGLSLLVVAPDGVMTTLRQNPTVYALHASADAGAVDIRAGATGPVLISDLGFGELAAVQVAPGDYTLSFFLADAPDTQVGGSNVVALVPGERYLAVAGGIVGSRGPDQPFRVAVYLEQFDLVTGPLLRMVQAIPDVALVDVSTVSGNALNTPPLFAELGFLEASAIEGTAVADSPGLRLGVAPSRSTTAEVAFDVDTTGIGRAFGVLAGALTPAAGERALSLLVIDTAVTPWNITPVRPVAR